MDRTPPPPPHKPPPSPCQMGVPTSQPLLWGYKGPMWSQLLQLLSLHPPTQLPLSFLNPLSPIFSFSTNILPDMSFKFNRCCHCLCFCAATGTLQAAMAHRLFFVDFFYSSQQFAFYSVLFMSHGVAEKPSCLHRGEANHGVFNSPVCPTGSPDSCNWQMTVKTFRVLLKFLRFAFDFTVRARGITPRSVF